MNNRTLTIIAGMSVFFLLALIFIFFWSGIRKEPTDDSSIADVSIAPSVSESAVTTTTTQTTQSVTTSTTSETSATPMYIVGQSNGKLAVYKPNVSSPFEVYDIYLSSLPAEEQQRLKAGIPIYDEASLAKLLEDYTS